MWPVMVAWKMIGMSELLRSGDQENLLDALQLIEARIADADIELESHDRDVDTTHRAFVANGSTAMTTVMLSNA